MNKGEGKRQGRGVADFFTSPSLSATTTTSSRDDGRRAPRLRIVRAEYGAGTAMVDVTDILQRMVDEQGGLTIEAFGHNSLLRRDSPQRMNAAFGDPVPGRAKQLLISYEIEGCRPHLITTPEDKRVKLDMGHMYRKVVAPIPPEEVKKVAVEIIKATYGQGDKVFDVTTVLQSMHAAQGGKGFRAFGYTIAPNGCMNKAFGDPLPGVDKILAIEYRWRVSGHTQCIDEDKRMSLNFEKLRPLL